MMTQQVAFHIPSQWLEGVADEELTLQHIFRLGLQHYKIERALQSYQDGVGSLGYLAAQFGLDKPTLIREARRHHIDPAFSDQTVQEELAE